MKGCVAYKISTCECLTVISYLHAMPTHPVAPIYLVLVPSTRGMPNSNSAGPLANHSPAHLKPYTVVCLFAQNVKGHAQVVKMKGRVACEISTCECLIATEAVFMGLFSDLDPAEAVALLSSLVNQHKIKVENPEKGLTPPLALALGQLQQLTLQLGVMQLEAGVPEMDPEEFLTVSVRPSLVEVRAV